MSTTSDFDRLARAWLDEGPTQLSDFALDAALEEIHLTRQRHALRVPWRFRAMPVLSRATAVATVALVAVVGAGGALLIANRGTDPASHPSPSPTTAPSATPAVVYPAARRLAPAAIIDLGSDLLGTIPITAEGDDIPDQLTRRLLSVRAYDGNHMLVDADVVQGDELEDAAQRLLRDASYLHVHNAGRGCYAARIERA